MISNDSTVWEDTLLAVEEGQAVPVIGRDLLVVDTETGPQRYHRLVAERLAAELKIPTDHLPPEFDTNDVICAYEKFHGDSTGFSPRVVRIVKELKVPLCRRCSEISGAGSDDQNCGIPLWVAFSVHCEHSGNSWEWRSICIVHCQNRFGGVNSMRILRLLWDVIFPFQIVWPHRSRDHFGHYSRLAGFNTNAIMRVIYEQDEDFENRR